jgi:hypothetical protein
MYTTGNKSQVHFTKKREPDPKGSQCILFEFLHVTFWKRQTTGMENILAYLNAGDGRRGAAGYD